MVVSKSGAAKITGLPTRIRANDPIKTAIADAMALARPIPKKLNSNCGMTHQQRVRPSR